MLLLASGLSLYRAMIRDIIKEGKIVPSVITVNLIRRAIESSKNHKILIDGFPRSDENRIAFERIVSFYLQCTIGQQIYAFCILLIIVSS